MRFFLLLLLASYAQLSTAIGLADLELKSHLGETLKAQLSVVDLPPNADVSCFSVDDLSETGQPQKITLSLQTKLNGLQLLLSSAEVLLEPIVNLRLSYACEPKLERDYTLLLDPAPKQALSSQQEAMDTMTMAAYAARPSVAAVGKKRAPKRVASAPAKSRALRDPTWESTIDEKLLAAYTGKPSQVDASKSQPSPPAASSSQASKPGALIISGATAKESLKPAGLNLRLSKSIDTNRPPALPADSAEIDESTVMANRLAHLDKQIAALQERNRLLQIEAEIRQQQNTYLALPSMLTAAFILAVLGLAWWLRRRMWSRPVRPEPDWFAQPAATAALGDNTASQTDSDFSLATDASLSPDTAAAFSIEEITMPVALGNDVDLIKEAPLDDDAGWDFSQTANSKTASSKTADSDAADKMDGK
ncbi:hypothetical protein MCETRH20_00037 [Methylophilaceae bacterium]